MFGKNVGFDCEPSPDISVNGVGVDGTSGLVEKPLDVAFCPDAPGNSESS